MTKNARTEEYSGVIMDVKETTVEIRFIAICLMIIIPHNIGLLFFSISGNGYPIQHDLK